jgi:O-antigen/teichoic acid export membrane protein
VVGAADYGFYFSLFNFSILLNIILDFGITNFNNRNIAQHNHLLSKYLSNIFALKLMLAVVYFVVSILVGYVIGYNWAQFQLLFFLILNQFIASFILYLRSNISALHLFKTDSLISVMDRTLMIIICGVLLWGNVTERPFQIEWFVYAQTAAYLLTFLVTFLIVLSKSDFFRVQFDKAYALAILKRCFPFALLTLLMASYTRIDSVMLERMLVDGKEQAGIYAHAFRIFDAASVFALLFASLLLPMFSRMIKHGEPVGQLTQFSFLLLLAPALLFAISSTYYRQEIMDLLYHGPTRESAAVFGVLIMGFVAVSTTYIFGTLLTANGNLRELNIMAAGGVVLNVVLNLILIPSHKAFGSAVASLITQFVTAAVQVFLARKIFTFHFNWNLISLFIFYIIGITTIGYVLQKLDFYWLYEFGGLLVLGGLLALAIRLIRLKVLYQIIKFGDEGA